MGCLKIIANRELERIGKNRSRYYPFGLQTEASWHRSWKTQNQHLFNGGSERNEETQYYETFYRNYDASIGRFMAVDPLASSFSSLNPYQYALNDPIAINDPNGDYCSQCAIGGLSPEAHLGELAYILVELFCMEG